MGKRIPTGDVKNNPGILLGQRRSWANITPALGQCIMSSGEQAINWAANAMTPVTANTRRWANAGSIRWII